MGNTEPERGTAGALSGVLSGMITAAGDLERAAREIGRRLQVLDRERTEAREVLGEGLRSGASGGAERWQQAADGLSDLVERLSAWAGRRVCRADVMRAEAASRREAVEGLAGAAVADVVGVSGALVAALDRAGARGAAMEGRIEGVAEFLRLLVREQHGLAGELEELEALLGRQQKARRHRRTIEVREAAAAASVAGFRAWQRGDAASAEREFRRAWELEGTSCARHNLILVLLLTGQRAAATSLLEEPDPADGDPVVRQTLLALRAYLEGRFEEARREAEAGLAVDPGQVLLRQMAAAAAARAGAPAEALRLGQGLGLDSCGEGGREVGPGAEH